MKLNEYLRSSQAAKKIGVDKGTLLRGSLKNKIRCYIHPNGKYRLYKEEDVENLLKSLKEQHNGET